MKTSKMTLWYNNVHFLCIPIILIALLFKYPIFIIFLIIYLAYIFKRKIFLKEIILVSILFFGLFYFYNNYTPKFKNFEGIIIEQDNNRYTVFNGIISVEIYSNESYALGDIIKVEGDKYKPYKESYEGGFSSYEFKKSKRIYYIYKNPKLSKKGHIIIPLELRQKTIHYLDKKLNTKSVSYISSLLLGENIIDSETKESLNDIGISHLFAISGFHISLIFIFLSFVFKKIFESERIRNNIIIFLFVFYIFFTGFQISILRASIMIILNILNKRYNKLFTSLDILSATLIFTLILNPGYFYMTAFKFTFLITFFLIISKNIIKGNFKTFKISLLAFMSGLPIVINMNYEINLLQILLTPIFTVVIGYLLIPYLFLVAFIHKLEVINIIDLFEKAIKILDINWFKITIGYMNIYFIILYYMFFVFILIMIERNKINKKTIILFLIYMLFVINIKYIDPYYRIEFIDVGQGDSILITSKHNKDVILIDTFGYNYKYIKRRGIKKIDKLIITHSDLDHIGGIENTLNYFEVKTIISSAYDNIDYKSQGIKSGDVIISKDLKFNVLGPINNSTNKNDISIVLMLNICNYKILFTGDMESEEEKSLINKYGINLKADVLKVGHHGSKTSSTKEFINFVNPKYSVISCGLNNKYNFPNEEVLLNLCKSKIYRTDLMGNITIKIHNNKMDIKGYK